MQHLKTVVPLALALGTLAAGPASAQAQPDNERFVRLSFSDGRDDAAGIAAVNDVLRAVGVRVSEVPIPVGARPLIETSRHRGLDAGEQDELLSLFALDREALLGEVTQAGRKPAVEGGGALSISEEDVPPYPKVYDMMALDAPTVSFLMRKFGRLHVNSADPMTGIDEVMTVVSGGPYTWFFVLEDETVAKVRFSTVEDGDAGWRISYPGLVPHGGYFDAPHGLVVANAHGPETFVMRYAEPRVAGTRQLNDNPWIDFTAEPPRLLDRARTTAR